jgi:hypothetical protein
VPDKLKEGVRAKSGVPTPADAQNPQQVKKPTCKKIMNLRKTLAFQRFILVDK